ncbi:SDR family oxidoreductase [Metapseudomonas furukawaii]|jgi:NAD(P)-dependent dehydrogenase (short-subunit alcohol dehydrogenase family)|uniref:SDR family oxidoreductase n=1 Tax=Metapseudomonas furukawaii TaxID=1149133 RepID=UPI00227A9A6B|nr:SDR family oxidoreductase [Pseudomonas furukawaii]WAG81083.1 SDR family oxidoreductase [Pseudomonas furukawaii]
MNKELLIITGLGAMGLACARRLGTGRRLLLVDNSTERLREAEQALAEDGHSVECLVLDLGAGDAAQRLVERIEALGATLRLLLHTAAVSPTQASARTIYQVNLEGTARLLEQLTPYLAPGAVGVVIASMAGQFVSLTPEQEQALANVPTQSLSALAAGWEGADDSNQAYMVAKRGNQLRVEAEALRWAKRGARLVSISPGIISTAQGRQEVAEQPQVAQLVRDCPVGRIGTPEDIAACVEWLASPAAGFVTGTDLRIDGGTIAALRWAAER